MTSINTKDGELTPDTDERVDLVCSTLTLAVKAVVNKYKNPKVAPKAMNDELDKAYFEAKAVIKDLLREAYDNAIFDVQIMREVWLTKDDVAGDVGDETVAIRNQLRKEIVADIEKRKQALHPIREAGE